MSARSHRPPVRYKKSKSGKVLKVAKEIHSLARNAWGIYNGVKHGDWSGVGFRRYNPYQTKRGREIAGTSNIGLYDSDEDIPILDWYRIHRDDDDLLIICYNKQLS